MPRGHDTLKFVTPRFTIYRVICERLETIDHVTDAIECLQQMVGELADETDIHDEQAKWILGKPERTQFQMALMRLIYSRFHPALR